MKSPRVLVLLSAALMLAACNKTAGDKTAAPSTDNVAIVNGTAISRNTFAYYVQGVAGKAAADLTVEQRGELLDNLIRGELVAADAEKTGIAARDETRAVLELSRLNVLQQAAARDFLKDRKATDEELKAEYDTQVAALPRAEYHARHILVNTEEFARSIIRQLDNGANFAALAKKESTDNGSKQSGGDLGWFTPDRMVPAFAAAVVGLEKGKYTKQPVKTDFGWHVIYLEDMRQAAPPPFDSVKDRLVQIVEAKKFKAHTDELVRTAKIEKLPEPASLNLPGTAPAPAAPPAPAAQPAEAAPAPSAAPTPGPAPAATPK